MRLIRFVGFDASCLRRSAAAVRRASFFLLMQSRTNWAYLTSLYGKEVVAVRSSEKVTLKYT